MNNDIASIIAAYNMLQEEATTIMNTIITSDDAMNEIRQTSQKPKYGKGNAASGAKAIYVREKGKGENYYRSVRDHHDPSKFETVCGLSLTEFDELYRKSSGALSQPMNVRFEYEDQEQSIRASRKRSVPDHVMLFCFLVCLRAGNEGGSGVEKIALDFGVSKGTVSNYVRHVSQALLDVLSDDEEAFIDWPMEAERRAMCGLVFGFPKCVGFVDGTKQAIFRPGNDEEQADTYDGHHHIHCYSVLVWTDVFGIITRLDITLIGSRHDRGIYNDCDPFKYPTQYFSSNQLVIADLGFTGSGDHIAFPFKRGQGLWFEMRTSYNKDIRRQRIRNEWSIGLVKNRFRIFLGRWPFEDTWFPIIFTVASHLVNLRIRRSGTPPVPMERMLERLQLYEDSVMF